MEAILISEENSEKLEEIVEDRDLDLDLFNRASTNWYLVRNYVDHKGLLRGNRILPEATLRDAFVVDLAEAKTRWSTIFRQTPEQTLPYKDSE